MLGYVLSYNVRLSSELQQFFDFEHLWRADPHGALKYSFQSSVACDASIGPVVPDDLIVNRFLEILFSAIPRCHHFGSLVGFSRDYIMKLAASDETAKLVELTNYIFKSLYLEAKLDSFSCLERVQRLFRELHYIANVALHRIISKRVDYRTISFLLNQAAELALGTELQEEVVFVFLTKKYLSNMELWLKLYLTHDPRGRRLLVLAVGDNFSDELQQMLAKCGATEVNVLFFQPPFELSVCGNGMDLKFLWYIKVYFANLLLQRGSRVIYSDLDAYWVKSYFDVRDGVRRTTGADVILSMTYDMPAGAVMEWSFTPCAGFFSAEPTMVGKRFFSAWCEMTEVMFDDQIGLAELLHRQNIQWEPVKDAFAGACVNFFLRDGSVARIALLDIDTARRVGLADPKTIGACSIWHPRWVMAPEDHGHVIDMIVAGQKTPSLSS